jgi:hypothetical protein
VVLKKRYHKAEKAWAKNEQRKDGSQRAKKSGEHLYVDQTLSFQEKQSIPQFLIFIGHSKQV